MSAPITPKLAVDLYITRQDGRILLIQRKHEPFGWALPGGFVNVGETVEAAAVRELFEETGCSVLPEDLTFFGIYSDPARDPRGHTVSIVYMADISNGHADNLQAGDDAANLGWFGNIVPIPEQIAFDHKQIIKDVGYSLINYIT